MPLTKDESEKIVNFYQETYDALIPCSQTENKKSLISIPIFLLKTKILPNLLAYKKFILSCPLNPFDFNQLEKQLKFHKKFLSYNQFCQWKKFVEDKYLLQLLNKIPGVKKLKQIEWEKRLDQVRLTFSLKEKNRGESEFREFFNKNNIFDGELPFISFPNNSCYLSLKMSDIKKILDTLSEKDQQKEIEQIKKEELYKKLGLQNLSEKLLTIPAIYTQNLEINSLDISLASNRAILSVNFRNPQEYNYFYHFYCQKYPGLIITKTNDSSAQNFPRATNQVATHNDKNDRVAAKFDFDLEMYQKYQKALNDAYEKQVTKNKTIPYEKAFAMLLQAADLLPSKEVTVSLAYKIHLRVNIYLEDWEEAILTDFCKTKYPGLLLTSKIRDEKSASTKKLSEEYNFTLEEKPLQLALLEIQRNLNQKYDQKLEEFDEILKTYGIKPLLQFLLFQGNKPDNENQFNESDKVDYEISLKNEIIFFYCPKFLELLPMINEPKNLVHLKRFGYLASGYALSNVIMFQLEPFLINALNTFHEYQKTITETKNKLSELQQLDESQDNSFWNNIFSFSYRTNTNNELNNTSADTSILKPDPRRN